MNAVQFHRDGGYQLSGRSKAVRFDALPARSKSTSNTDVPASGICIPISASHPMQCVYRLIQRASAFDFPVLILGESGTGKELVARSIHAFSTRHARCFVPVDCGALVPSLIESELFGHVSGAFTGADRSKRGLLADADGGTIFFDEIGELPTSSQAKLLRFLQEKQIRPVGSRELIPINVRVLAATNRDLDAAMLAGIFRQDLYFRLNILRITVPPLRERKADIPLLVTYFLERFSDGRCPARKVSDEGLRRLMAYDWPGNVRELQNAIECATALSTNRLLGADDFTSVPIRAEDSAPSDKDDSLLLAQMERRAIMDALLQTDGDKLAAARLLGIGKTTIYRKLKEYASGSGREVRIRVMCPDRPKKD